MACAPGRRLRVVVVDDQPTVRARVRRLLAADGRLDVVGEAADGAAALAVVARLTPDVVVMDVRMPVLDGVAAAAQIARLWPWIAVLLCSSDPPPAVPGGLPLPFVTKEQVTAEALLELDARERRTP